MKKLCALLVLCSVTVLAGCQPQDTGEEPMDDTNTTWVSPTGADATV